MWQAEPVEVLKYLMDQGGLRQQDLRTELGSISNISMILSGQRKLTLSNASALAARFNVDMQAFLPRALKRAAEPQAGRAHRGQAQARTNKTGTMSVRSSDWLFGVPKCGELRGESESSVFVYLHVGPTRLCSKLVDECQPNPRRAPNDKSRCWAALHRVRVPA